MNATADDIQQAKLENLKNLAKEKGGLCLSNEFINKTTKLKWQCRYGHIWETTPKVVLNGHWCPHCAGTAKLDIQQAKLFARQKNGLCLSDTYKNNRTNMLWQCEKGHQWRATFHSVKDQETWCPVCSADEVNDINKILKNFLERGGKCLSKKKNITPNSLLLLQCPKGHVWKTKLRRYISCPHCTRRKTNITIKDMQVLASLKGGKCLSDKYINNRTKLKWECKNGHIWYAMPYKIKSGRWCPECIGRKKLTINEMHLLAQKREGLLLSGNYKNYTLSTKFRWQCKKGHIWESTAGRIKQGRWCPLCIKNRHLKLHDVQKLAEKKGGKCLSEKYINNYTKLKWQCKEGHIWETTLQIIRSGCWCPECSNKSRRLTIEIMQKMAKLRGGKCLSTEYTNKRTKLKWQCKEGHIWDATPDSTRRGIWCPACSRIKRTSKKEIKK